MSRLVRVSSFLVLTGALAGCAPTVDDDDGASTGSEATTAADAGEEGETGTAWNDVACGEATCGEGEICLQRGQTCDYSPCNEGGMAQWVTPDPTCEAVPESCDPDDTSCLTNVLCEDPGAGPSGLEDGLLSCWPAAHGCFC